MNYRFLPGHCVFVMQLKAKCMMKLQLHWFNIQYFAYFDNRIKLHAGNTTGQPCGQGAVRDVCGYGKLPQADVIIKNQIPKLLFSGLGYLHMHHPFFCAGLVLRYRFLHLFLLSLQFLLLHSPNR